MNWQQAVKHVVIRSNDRHTIILKRLRDGASTIDQLHDHLKQEKQDISIHTLRNDLQKLKDADLIREKRDSNKQAWYVINEYHAFKSSVLDRMRQQLKRSLFDKSNRDIPTRDNK